MPAEKPNPNKSKKLVDAGVNVGRWWNNDVDYGEGRESEDEKKEAAAEEEEEEAAESDTNSTSSGEVADATAAGGIL